MAGWQYDGSLIFHHSNTNWNFLFCISRVVTETLIYCLLISKAVMKPFLLTLLIVVMVMWHLSCTGELLLRLKVHLCLHFYLSNSAIDLSKLHFRSLLFPFNVNVTQTYSHFFLKIRLNDVLKTMEDLKISAYCY